MAALICWWRGLARPWFSRKTMVRNAARVTRRRWRACLRPRRPAPGPGHKACTHSGCSETAPMAGSWSMPVATSSSKPLWAAPRNITQQGSGSVLWRAGQPPVRFGGTAARILPDGQWVMTTLAGQRSRGRCGWQRIGAARWRVGPLLAERPAGADGHRQRPGPAVGLAPFAGLQCRRSGKAVAVGRAGGRAGCLGANARGGSALLA